MISYKRRGRQTDVSSSDTNTSHIFVKYSYCKNKNSFACLNYQRYNAWHQLASKKMLVMAVYHVFNRVLQLLEQGSFKDCSYTVGFLLWLDPILLPKKSCKALRK